jgi:hypothetical protein
LKRLVDEPKRATDRKESKQSETNFSSFSSIALGLSPTPTSQTQTEKAKNTTHSRGHIMRHLIAIGVRLMQAFLWCDKHDGGITALATIAIAVLTVVYVTYSKKQWIAMEKANAITLDTLHTAHRPWVFIADGLVSSTKPLSFGADGKVTTEVSYSIKNIGSSPALQVSNFPVIRVAKINTFLKASTPWTSKDELAAVAKLAGVYLLPGETRQSPSLPVTGERYFPQGMPIVTSGGFGVVLEICIPYLDEFNYPHATCDYWEYRPNGEKSEFIPAGVLNGQWKRFAFGAIAY